VGFEVALYATYLRIRHRGEDLLAAVRTLQIGETTFTETQALRTAFAATRNLDASIGGRFDQSYSIRIYDPFYIGIGLYYPMLVKFGVRPSGPAVDLFFNEGKLSYLRYSFYAASLSSTKRPLMLIGEIQMQQRADEPYRGDFAIAAGTKTKGFTFGNRGDIDQIFISWVSPGATDEQRRAAFDFDLSCMSKLRGCRATCEMLPSLWREALRRYENKELSLPEELVQNPVCTRRYRPEKNFRSPQKPWTT
jgi:hypothetical protein